MSVRIPPHRSAVVYYAAQIEGDVPARLRALERRLEGMPEAATGPHHAHLQRARDALAAGRPEKALASLLRAEERAPLLLTAELRNAALHIRAECPNAQATDDFVLTARYVPLPGVKVALERAARQAFVASVPLPDLGTRYDYERREYVPYFGAVEVQVTGTMGDRVAAASCVVEVPRR